ncbi:tandem-type lipoprotein [Staphylococcus hyicus]|uniref:tandem-type lipoprotein n=1 Tax=Staphylococcus hyicus TaxID=1284 RepID=UPI0027389B65|nr:tandem-type lipoprotein [Staphylococcus hyicus]MDP4449312.1 tandem-type lipoprotein [Staphylococcus hyicus]
MKLMKKIIIIAGLMMSIGLLTSCGMSTREKIESGLKEPLSVYPTKNLEDFYDKEGYRDSNFSKDDKGVWSIITVIGNYNDEGKLRMEGVILYIDRNTKKSEGYYFIDNESKDEHKNGGKKYPLVMKDNQLILKDKNVDEDIQRKVKGFKFFVQFGNLNDLNRYKLRNANYNTKAPNYSISYYLNQSDENLNLLKKHYGVKVGEQPRIEIYGDGNFKSDTPISDTIEFVLDNKNNEYFSTSVSYKPKKGVNYE